MLARRLTTILLAMTLAEAIETTRIHSVAGLTGDRMASVTTRPFRALYHTISEVGLIDGGIFLRQVRCRGHTNYTHQSTRRVASSCARSPHRFEPGIGEKAVDARCGVYAHRPRWPARNARRTTPVS
jgi:hypothetical protein